tara:strand:+ start:230 stop:640 length:411 start_codon:yes stop_codon:yes gene_type:complete
MYTLHGLVVLVGVFSQGTADECAAYVDDHRYQTPPVAPISSSSSAPLENKYSALLTKTCSAALTSTPVLPTADVASFMNAYVAYNGSNSELDVIKYADALLSRTDVKAFLDLPGSFSIDGNDANLVSMTKFSTILM